MSYKKPTTLSHFTSSFFSHTSCVCLPSSKSSVNEWLVLISLSGWIWSLQFPPTQSRAPSLVTSGEPNNETHKALCFWVWPLYLQSLTSTECQNTVTSCWLNVFNRSRVLQTAWWGGRCRLYHQLPLLSLLWKRGKLIPWSAEPKELSSIHLFCEAEDQSGFSGTMVCNMRPWAASSNLETACALSRRLD